MSEKEGHISEPEDKENITRQQFEYYKFQVNFLMKEFNLKEKKIRATNEELRKQKDEIFRQKQDLERKTEELQKVIENYDSSIVYASYIQSVILGNQVSVKDFFEEVFILYKPKDLVSGDFYWFHKIDDEKSVLAVGDCAGHGAAGALMTTLIISLLNEIIIKEGERNPNFILGHLDTRLNNALKGYNEMLFDGGLDISLLYYDKSMSTVAIAATNQNVYHLRKNKLSLINGVKVKLGNDTMGRDKIFNETSFYVQQGDTFFLSTDGFLKQQDEEEVEFGNMNFENQILESAESSLEAQKNDFENRLNEWKGANKQSDDILLVGIKI